jgi:subtilisin-like proprotein convertase family protein
MKKVTIFFVCICLALSGLSLSAQAAKSEKPHHAAKTVNPEKALKRQIAALQAEIIEGKAAGRDVSALRQELRALRATQSDEPRTPIRGLDDGGDVCGSATIIGSLPYTDNGTLDGYANDYDQSCGSSGGVEVVYEFSPASDVTINASTCGMDDFDTVIEIYEGCPDDEFSVLVECNDDFCDVQSCVIAQLAIGATYYIVVSGYDNFESGDYVLNVVAGDVCVDESDCQGTFVAGGGDCEEAVLLTLPVAIIGNNSTASVDYLETDCYDYELYFPQWYAVVGDGTTLTARTCACYEFDTILNVFCGNCCNFECIASNDDACGGPDGYQSEVTWCSEAGVTYLVIVAGYYSDEYGDYSLTIESGEPCEGEPCSPSDIDCSCPDGDNVHCTREVCAAISDNDTSSVEISVPLQYHITDVNVCVTIAHTYIGDLDIWLESPAGTTVALFDQECSSDEDIPCVTFDDESADNFADFCDLDHTGASYNPEGSLSDVDGENALGTWTLYVADNADADVGAILAACLSFEYDEILSVELTSFDATAGDGRVTLNWQTASEMNNDRFDILRNGNKIAEINATNSATGSSYSWTDENVLNGVTYNYALISVDMNGAREELGTVNATPNFNTATVTDYALHQNYPNPFNPTTNISFDLVDAGFVKLSVYNMLGQQVATVVNGNFSAGRHVVTFDATGLSSGLYLYKIEANGFTAQKKLLLMK